VSKRRILFYLLAQNNIAFQALLTAKYDTQSHFRAYVMRLIYQFYKTLSILKLFAADWGGHKDPVCSLSRRYPHTHLLYLGEVEPGTYCPTVSNLTTAPCTVALRQGFLDA
jgi:hypothetical protein